MNLKNILDAYKNNPKHSLLQHQQEMLDTYIHKLNGPTSKKHWLKVGDIAPDFQLPLNNPSLNQTTSFHLYEQLKKGPIILTFIRGSWCSYCNLQLQAYEEVLDAIKHTGTQLIGISLEASNPYKKSSLHKNNSIPLLMDHSGTVSTLYKLLYPIEDDLAHIYRELGIDLTQINENKRWVLPITSTFIIDQHGLIRHTFSNADYRVRMEPKDILSILNVIT